MNRGVELRRTLPTKKEVFVSKNYYYIIIAIIIIIVF